MDFDPATSRQDARKHSIWLVLVSTCTFILERRLVLGKTSKKSSRVRHSKPFGSAPASQRMSDSVVNPSGMITADGDGRNIATYLPPNFETPSTAAAEDALRFRLLSHDLLTPGSSARRLFSHGNALTLACDLLSASKGVAPESLASSVHMRAVREPA